MRYAGVSIYKTKDKRYQVSYQDSQGNRIRNKVNTYRDAKTKAQAISERIISSDLVATDKNISALILDFLEKNPTSSMKTRSPAVFKSFINRFGNCKVYEINSIVLRLWLENLKDEMGYSSRTMLQCKYMFTPFFRELVDQKILESSPWDRIKIKKGTRVRERIFLSEDELRIILAGLKEFSPDYVYPVTYFLIHTGCRIGEALNLKWDEIDFIEGLIKFPGTASSSKRKIRISPNLSQLLSMIPKSGESIFLNPKGAPWSDKKYYKELVKGRSYVGLERKWDNSSFRHSFAYHFLRKGGTLKQLQVVLGHSNVGETIEAYGNIFAKEGEKLSPYEKS